MNLKVLDSICIEKSDSPQYNYVLKAVWNGMQFVLPFDPSAHMSHVNDMMIEDIINLRIKPQLKFEIDSAIKAYVENSGRIQ